PKGHWYWKQYPPTAENWADPSFAIPGWRVLSSGESPQPGDVVGQRIQWPNGATGHAARVDFCSRPSKNPQSFAFHVLTDVGRQSRTIRIANFDLVVKRV